MTKTLDRYIDRLIRQGTPEALVWNIEKVREDSKSTWSYIGGCMIKTITELYLITRNRQYLNFADAFTGHFVREDGSIGSYDPKEHNLDNVSTGKTLFNLYKLIGKEEYRRAVDTVYSQLKGQPHISTGNFRHKKIYSNQIWPGGLYMTQPSYMQYETEYNGCKDYEDSHQQFLQVYDQMRDPLSGLYYHAHDDSHRMFRCDKMTGLPENFWLRAMGWCAMMLIDTVEVMPEPMTCQKVRLNTIYKELIDTMFPYQGQVIGIWYRVINRGGVTPNYLEESDSAIFAYAIMRSVRLHYFSDDYFKYGQKALEGVCNTYLPKKDDSFQLSGICLVTGLGNMDMREGTFEHYMREPVIENEAKGITPLTLTYIGTMF